MAPFLVWFKQFMQELTAQASVLGISTAEVAAAQKDYDWLAFATAQSEAHHTHAKSVGAFRDLLHRGKTGQVLTWVDVPVATPPAGPPPPSGALRRLRRLVQRVKGHPNYTPPIGKALGVVATVTPLPTSGFSPPLRVRALMDHQVEVKYRKGRFSGAVIESRRGAETSWTPLIFALRTKFIDKRPPLQPGVPELRKYRACYRRHDEPVGEYSQEITAVTTP